MNQIDGGGEMKGPAVEGSLGQGCYTAADAPYAAALKERNEIRGGLKDPMLPELKRPADPMIGVGGGPTRNTTMPTDAAGRKRYPVATGLLDYFPDALAAVAHLSWKGNEQHNPGQDLHWARAKSADEADTLMRHMLQRGTVDTDGIRHSVKVAWRALAMLQKELEAASPELQAWRKNQEAQKAHATQERVLQDRERHRKALADTFDAMGEPTLRDIESALNIVAQRRAAQRSGKATLASEQTRRADADRI
jgi:hypothetical protein